MAAIELDAQEWGVKYTKNFPFPLSLFPAMWAGSDGKREQGKGNTGEGTGKREQGRAPFPFSLLPGLWAGSALFSLFPGLWAGSDFAGLSVPRVAAIELGSITRGRQEKGEGREREKGEREKGDNGEEGEEGEGGEVGEVCTGGEHDALWKWRDVRTCGRWESVGSLAGGGEVGEVGTLGSR